MSNSPLVKYTKISPNKNSPRNHKIDTITIHCVVGQASVESLGNVFANPGRQASSNYGIGFDGRIGLYVDENDRSWCSSSSSNDNRAITIEVASDNFYPYKVTDAALKSLVELCADICKRNGIPKLLWKADKALIGQPDKQNMTVHRWFANKSCPGEYLYSRHSWIAEEVNKKLSNTGVEKTAIMGKSKCVPEQLKKYLLKHNASLKINTNIDEFCRLWIYEGEIESVRGDIAFCQACHETGYFAYGGIVTPDMNNFGGLGAINNSPQGTGARFNTPQEGIRASIQHLKAYATPQPLKQACIDPRYDLVMPKGKAPYFEDLGGFWAYPGYDRKKYSSLEIAKSNQDTYGHFIIKKYKELEKIKVNEPQPEEPKEINVTEAKRIIKEKIAFNDNTIQHIWNYRWGDEALIRIARAIK